MSGDQPPETPPKPPRIVLTFDGTPGDVTITNEGPLSTGMLYAAAWQLEALARETRAGERAVAAQSQLKMAGGLDGLLRSMGVDPATLRGEGPTS